MGKLLLNGERMIACFPALAAEVGRLKLELAAKKKPGVRIPKQVPGAFLEALLLQQINYGLDQQYYTILDGKKWIKLPYAVLARQLGGSVGQLRRTINVLLELGLIEQHQQDVFSKVKPVRLNYKHDLFISAGVTDPEVLPAQMSARLLEQPAQMDRSPAPSSAQMSSNIPYLNLEEEVLREEEDQEKINTAPLPGDAALEAARLFVKLSEGLAKERGTVLMKERTPETIAATIRQLPPEAIEALPDALPWAAKNAYYAASMCNHAAWTGKTTGRWITLVNQFKVEPLKNQRRQSAYTPGHLIESPVYDEFKQVQMI